MVRRPPRVAPPLMASDIVKLNETVDTTLNGETKLVGAVKMKEMWERCIAVNRDSPPIDEEPSEHQMSALFVLLLLHNCYVDFAIWGGTICVLSKTGKPRDSFPAYLMRMDVPHSSTKSSVVHLGTTIGGSAGTYSSMVWFMRMPATLSGYAGTPT